MYATISLKRLLVILAWPFATILAGYVLVTGIPADLMSAVRSIGASVTIFSVLVVVVFGPTDRRWALWRLIWKVLPFLNRKAFPDLNGVWKGSTSSNWPTISTMLETAKGTGGLEPASLATVPLKSDGITMTITASLFSLRITAELEATGGKSHSLTERVSEDKRRGELELYYVYRQETPEPELTDDDSHLGAACLTIDLVAATLSGAYWTKRSWRSGLNTAGRIEVQRVSR
jgi:hypothetical protein